METTTIRRLPSLDEQHVHDLAQLLIDCVDGGASVSFMRPLSTACAEAFWRGLADAVARGARALLVAETVGADGAPIEIVGTVQLVLDQAENQPHRADVAKMLVHRQARRGGIGAALMQAAEQVAADEGKTLLSLDTVTGGAGERLYRRLGWQYCGEIPGFALWPDGGLCGTSIYFKTVSPAAA